MNNSDLIEKKGLNPCTQRVYNMTQPYKLLQCKKLIKSTKFVETKLGTLIRTQLLRTYVRRGKRVKEAKEDLARVHEEATSGG
jgi:hypothetical protein